MKPSQPFLSPIDSVSKEHQLRKNPCSCGRSKLPLQTTKAISCPEVQSIVFGFGQPRKSLIADGQVEPSGQQELPAHFVPEEGHFTVSPTLHCPGLGVGGGGLGVGGLGGLGVGGGLGGPGGLFVQSSTFFFGHPAKALSAEGHIEPSGQQESPAHFVMPPPGHNTVSPTLHCAGLGGVGAGGLGVGAGGLGGVGVGGLGLGVGPGEGPGDGPFVQSISLALGQPLKVLSAEGQVDPSGQHDFPAQTLSEPGQRTVSPT